MKSSGKNIWPLVIQPLAIFLALGLIALWIFNADLTTTEQVTLTVPYLWELTMQHLSLTLVAALVVLVTAIPLGVLLTRKPLRWLTTPVMMLANVGQAAPVIGLVVLFAFWLGFGFKAAVSALILYAFLPVLKNTMVGLDAVDRNTIEAGRGMGMSALAVLFRIELPLAVPIMLAGIRTALVLLVGTATLATFVDGGGLGLLITTGVNLALDRVLITGSLLVALLALLIDWIARVFEQLLRPKGQ
ncbi:ABC transporter permease [Corynebacterium canis]|uniref:ABC transporter permease n=1 Tax=Corynebacterium canis TaxID=679663 RepID=A0A5C5UFF4_9CORY|nr:ABC transporter permease [Corynebacterium canis]TWT24547.1 ABC transporter permease [Corynebacterium canis]WJY75424.1 Glycine betaine/carnitine/choline transport system permease protein OpuCB [Corynebacterium canis]